MYCLHCLLFKVHFPAIDFINCRGPAVLPTNGLSRSCRRFERLYYINTLPLFCQPHFNNYFSVLFPSVLVLTRLRFSCCICLLSFAAGQFLYYNTEFTLLQPSLNSFNLCGRDLYLFLFFMLCFISISSRMLRCDSEFYHRVIINYLNLAKHRSISATQLQFCLRFPFSDNRKSSGFRVHPY